MAITSLEDDAYTEMTRLGQDFGFLSFLVYDKLTGEIRNKIKTIPLVKKLDDKHIEFYPNILIDRRQIGSYAYAYAYTPTVDKIRLERSQSRTAIKWENADVLKSTLGKVKQLTYPKFIRELLEEGHTITDDQLRDYGAALRAAAKPYELKFAESADDYIHMYFDNYSCTGILTYRDAYSRAGVYWAWWKLVDNKTPPHSWIMYNPQTQGVYIEDKQGKVIARTVLCRTTVDGPWEGYSQIYGNSSGKAALRMVLGNKGITQFKGPMAQKVMFRMPAVEGHNKHIICPSCALDTFGSVWFGYTKPEPGDTEAPYGYAVFHNQYSKETPNQLKSVYQGGVGYITLV